MKTITAVEKNLNELIERVQKREALINKWENLIKKRDEIVNGLISTNLMDLFVFATKDIDKRIKLVENEITALNK